MNNADKVPQVAIVFNNCAERLALWEWRLYCQDYIYILTLVGNPFSLLDSLWSGAQSHEIAFDNVLGAIGVEPKREGSGEVVRVDDVVTALDGTAGFVHTDCLSKRR